MYEAKAGCCEASSFFGASAEGRHESIPILRRVKVKKTVPKKSLRDGDLYCLTTKIVIQNEA